MSSAFDKCAVLRVTGNRNKGPKSYEDSDFKGKPRKLMMVVDPKGYGYSCTLMGGGFMPPDEVNKMLEELGVDVRVDQNNAPYVVAEPPKVEHPEEIGVKEGMDA